MGQTPDRSPCHTAYKSVLVAAPKLNCGGLILPNHQLV